MTLVHTDSRSRVSLAKVLQANRDYRVSVSPHGTVVLEPVTTISDYEQKILSIPGVADQLDQAVSAIDRGEVRAKVRRK